jgi:translation initiation factor IF-2
MRKAGMADEASYDHGIPACANSLFVALTFILVLTSEYAVLLADEFNRNPVVNDEAAFDLYPP